MKMNQFRSILAVAVVAASIIASVSPAQAFTWDDLWGAVKKGVEKGLRDAAQSASEKSNDSTSESTQTTSTNPSEQPNILNNNSEPLQGEDDINDTYFE